MTIISTYSTTFRDRVVGRLPESIQKQLNEAQKQALARAAIETRSVDWSDVHKLDLRYTIPFFGKRYYLRILSGQERRPIIRVIADQKRSMVRLIDKIFLLGIIVALFYSVIGISLLFFSQVLT